MILPFPREALFRATSRAIIEQSKSKKPAMIEPHILNFYEDFGMPISELYELVDAALSGKLENVQEKMDGQSITFTVVDGMLRLFVKGATYKKVLEGGLTPDRINQKYANNESVRSAFIKAYNTIKPIAERFDSETNSQLFQNGKVVIQSELLTPENPNTIVYDEPSIRFITAKSLVPDEASVDKSLYDRFISEASEAVNEEFTLGPVPYVKLKKSLETGKKEIEEINSQIKDLTNTLGLSESDTVGDIVHKLVRNKIDKDLSFIPENLRDLAAERFASGKGGLGVRQLDSSLRDDFKSALKNGPAFVASAIIPLEIIIQKIGVYAFRNLEFALKASNHGELLGFIKKVEDAFRSGNVITDQKKLKGIEVALSRLSNSDLFEEATEGIVFQWKGKTRKLTGLFTVINKLRGFFAYGDAKFNDSNNDELDISEVVMRSMTRMIFEGGVAFKFDDRTVVTTHERIPRENVKSILSKFKAEILDKLNLEYLPIGSTGTDTETVGDIDIIVNEPDPDTLFQKINSLFSAEPITFKDGKVYSGPKVKRIGSISTVLFNVGDDNYIQVDVFPSKNMKDDEWMLAGGSRGKIKGKYRNILLSYVAKLASIKESEETGKKVKYTVSTHNGLIKKVDDILIYKVSDPDKFLPILGINEKKENIRSFEDLFDYLFSIYGREFASGFLDYVSIKDEKEGEKIKSHINKLISEIKLKDIILKLIVEQDASREDVARVDDDETEDLDDEKFEKEKEIASKIANIKSFTGKARLIFGILQSDKFFGSSIQKIIGASQGKKIIRFGLSADALEKIDPGRAIGLLYNILVPDHTDSVIELAPDEDPNPSGKYSAYMLPSFDNIMIIFGIAGVTGGARKTGYEYEISVRNSLSELDNTVYEGPDNSYSDIYLDVKSGKLGIEVKLPNAQAGEPTLRYDFDKEEFFASNPKPQNDDIANLINLDLTASDVKRRFKLIRDAINAFRKSRNEPQIESILGNISKEEYVKVVQPVLKKSGGMIKGKLLASYTVSARILRLYYMFKLAGLVQVKTKGLYHLHDRFKVTFVDSSGKIRTTELFEFPDAMGSVYFRNFRGGRYGIRAQLTKSPLKKLPVSGVDLDKQEDRELFVKAVKDISFPDPKKLAQTLSK